MKNTKSFYTYYKNHRIGCGYNDEDARYYYSVLTEAMEAMKTDIEQDKQRKMLTIAEFKTWLQSKANYFDTKKLLNPESENEYIKMSWAFRFVKEEIENEQ